MSAGRAEVIDPDRAVVIFFALDRFVEQRTERIVADDADDERFIGRGKSRIGPVDEATEIVEEDGLERVFALRGRSDLKRRDQPRQQRHGRDDLRSFQKLHLKVP